MPNRRTRRVWTLIDARARDDNSWPTLSHVCLVCRELLSGMGATMSVSTGGGSLEPLATTDASTEALEELQYTLGQGPAYDAGASTPPVLAPDLEAPAAELTWPVFAPAAVAQGVRAIFAFPVAVGAARLGILSVHRRSAGSLSVDELADGLVCAEAALELALDERIGSGRHDAEYPGDVVFSDQKMVRLSDRRMDIHQASGMVSVQLGVQVAEALARLRAYAYVHDRRLVDVAAAVVARRLRFTSDGANGHDPTDDDTDPESRA